MDENIEEDLVRKLKEAFDSVFSDVSIGDYPKEAVKVGTFVRTHRLDRLGVVTDAFYGDLDKNNNKIIIYTIFLFPKNNGMTTTPRTNEQYYVTNEYEYEVTAYLMMNPIDIKALSRVLGGGLFP